MTDLETIPETIPDAAANRRFGRVPKTGSALGNTALALWRAAQQDQPDAPWIRAREITAQLQTTPSATSANLNQLIARGLARKEQRSTTGASGRGAPTWYALTDVGAMACAAVFADLNDRTAG